MPVGEVPVGVTVFNVADNTVGVAKSVDSDVAGVEVRPQLVTSTSVAQGKLKGSVTIILSSFITSLGTSVVTGGRVGSTKLTIAGVRKFVPSIVRVSPPAASGLKLVIVGAPNGNATELEFIPQIVTTTNVLQGKTGGIVTVISVVLTTSTFVAGTPPTVTVVVALVPKKLVPVIVSVVPVRLTVDIVGAGSVNVPALVDGTPQTVTVTEDAQVTGVGKVTLVT